MKTAPFKIRHQKKGTDQKSKVEYQTGDGERTEFKRSGCDTPPGVGRFLCRQSDKKYRKQ